MRNRGRHHLFDHASGIILIATAVGPSRSVVRNRRSNPTREGK